MLRELIAWVLNNYLGKYVGNLNTAQLSVALLSGEVELENLPLRRDAFRSLGLPLQALSGTVGKIKLQIPVRQFRTAPWCILIENVYVVVGPVNLDEWDAEAEEQAELDYKLSRLDRFEAKWRASQEAALEGGYYASSYSGWLNYGTSLVTNIVENLELKIKNVHIRYEDAISIPLTPFSCGITIDSLSARSCDANWQVGFTTNWQQSAASFKLVELESMSFYWDPLTTNQTFGDIQPNELAEAMRQWKSSMQQRHFVISPVCAHAYFKRDRSDTPLRTRSRPRLVCELVLNEVQLTLNDWQYQQMVGCIRGLDDIAKYRRFRLLRPKHSVHNGPRAWWIYAIQCHGFRLKNQSQNVQIAKENRQYIEIYTKIIANPNETLTSESKEHKDRIEKERTFEELQILREICMTRMPTPENITTPTGDGTGVASPSSTESNQGRSMLVQWFPQWWGWHNPATPPTSPSLSSVASEYNSPPSTPSISMLKDQTQLEDEILNALAGSVENNSLLKRDAVFGKFDFTLKKGTLDICCGVTGGGDITAFSPPHLQHQSGETKLMLQLLFENLLLSIESRPRSGSHFVGLSLGSVYIKDFLTNNPEFPDLIRPQTKDDHNVATLSGHSRLQRAAAAAQQRFIYDSTTNTLNTNQNTTTPLFQMNYERKPLTYNTDYRLQIKSQSLDIVYNIAAFKWIIDFVMKPHQMMSTRRRIEAMKNKTKINLMKNWEQIIEGDLSERKSWTLEIDISAPQIIFAENFSNKTSDIVVIDLGRLQVTNQGNLQQLQQQNQQQQQQQQNDANMSKGWTMGFGGGGGRVGTGGSGGGPPMMSGLMKMHKDSEDEEAFMTPCSTPPGSPGSPSSTATNSPTLCSALSEMPPDILLNPIDNSLNEHSLHNKLYDSYDMNLTDMQVFVCNTKERWVFANMKSSSPLHVLDRFSISLQVERRVVYTSDPQFPSLTLSGSLPKLVAHINEHKIASITQMLNTISTSNIQSPHKQPGGNYVDEIDGELKADGYPSMTEAAAAATASAAENENEDEKTSGSEQPAASKLIVLQFVIDQMALEVQSRGRSIAELQVTGVKASFSKRLEDTSISLSVHGLLLVDAIQSFGPDFELLIASHRHVGMDSVSGSLKQSEPCSPNSPGSPDPMYDRRPTSPHTISKALTSLQRTNSATWFAGNDIDALITVEILFVTPEVSGGSSGEQLQIASIQFNNLDIIANQETIVELMGFVKRAFPQQKIDTTTTNIDEPIIPSATTTTTTQSAPPTNNIRTEITFDFHRLNVLVLRALMRDHFLVGRKVGTFTMSEARIHATLGTQISVEGSLGGLQVLDLTPEGIAHQRILSVGKDPLTESPPMGGGQDLLSSLTKEIYAMGQSNMNKDETVIEERRALSFKISRNVNACVDVRIRMASVWYTHCARFMQELSWCATEFKHYLKNLAKSIREKATDMALGLVQPRNDISTKPPTDNLTSPNHSFNVTTTFSQNVAPNENNTTTTTTTTNNNNQHKKQRKRQRYTSWSRKTRPINIDIKLDIVLATPVLVLPRSSCSPHVLVAHLGKISVTNFRNTNILPTPDVSNTATAAVVTTKNKDKYSLKEEDINPSTLFVIEDLNSSSLPKITPDEIQRIVDQIDSEEFGRRDKDYQETYTIDIRNMNLFSLDTTGRKGFRLSALPRAEEFYSCSCDAVPVLHDTAIRLEITRIIEKSTNIPSRSSCGDISTPVEDKDILNVSGSVIRPLNLSLSRMQYEQLIETLENVFKVPTDLIRPPAEVSTPAGSSLNDNITTIKTNRSLAFDQQATPRLLMIKSAEDKTTKNDQSFDENQRGGEPTKSRSSFMQPKVSFELPIFNIQLKNELNSPLIEISFRDFKVNYDRKSLYETSVEVSLRTLLMEDLLQDQSSKHRTMVVSSSPDDNQNKPSMRSLNRDFSSRSCPDLLGAQFLDESLSTSLPSDLQSNNKNECYKSKSRHHYHHHHYPKQQPVNNTECPDTPPPSPQQSSTTMTQNQDNLVLYQSLLIDVDCPTFSTEYKSMRQSSSIDFNSLDLVVSVQSWFVLLNFFGLLSDDIDNSQEKISNQYRPQQNYDEKVSSINVQTDDQQQGNTELDITVRSLTLVFICPGYEIARANVSNAQIILAKSIDIKTVEGRLGSISLIDLTVSGGAIYRERFLTTGNEALNFLYNQEIGTNRTNKMVGKCLKPDATLRIQMSSVRYVHTKRFVAEIQQFFKEFQRLQTPVLKKIKPSESRNNLQQRPMQLGLDIKAGSPIILLPMSANSDAVIIADLGEFSLKNSFHFSSEPGIISIKTNPDGPSDEILDVMHVELVNTNLFAGLRHSSFEDANTTNEMMDMGSYFILINSESLLNSKCHLKLIVERNMDCWNSQNVPDFSVNGTLSRLEATLNLQQYQLVRGFLSYNLGEPIDDLFSSEISMDMVTESCANLLLIDADEDTTKKSAKAPIWTNTSITLDLQDVSVRLRQPNDFNATTECLACINFIKSSLKIDSFSDGSQDIDLVSQEILITDSRATHENCFPNILQPIKCVNNSDSDANSNNNNNNNTSNNVVQAEIHSRRRQDASKYTILLNNMRLMAIIDWLESVRDFLSQSVEPPNGSIVTGDGIRTKSNVASGVSNSNTVLLTSLTNSTSNSGVGGTSEESVELVLNITDSELIFVERPDQWDTNALILKSTTIVSYRPIELNKVVSINLNNLEVFSCILGREEETALSIIDPVTVNLDLRRNILDVQLQKRLCIRLSYHDFRMFTQMLESLPKQTKHATTNMKNHDVDADDHDHRHHHQQQQQQTKIPRKPENANAEHITKLRALGFTTPDCIKALLNTDHQLDEAAIWLTQFAEPTAHNHRSQNTVGQPQNPLDINSVHLRANYISICVIDDCRDADVPLLELSLSQLEITQDTDARKSIIDTVAAVSSFKAGTLKGIFASDYYNRGLSGWEPLIEPWKCDVTWSYSLGNATASIQRDRLHLKVNSEDMLKLNITTTIIELYQLVHNNWTQDYYGTGSGTTASGTDMSLSPTTNSVAGNKNYRQRVPFIPFAIKNDTGVPLLFTTLITELGDSVAGNISAGGLNSRSNTPPSFTTGYPQQSSSKTNLLNQSQNWVSVEPGEIKSFSFGAPNKQRHLDSHKMNFHQIGVRVNGWTQVGPISVDKIGVFFRHSRNESEEFLQMPRTRIVFAVTLEGSAHKLVTVRSALQLHNKLKNQVLIKMEHFFGHLNVRTWPKPITAIVPSQGTFSVPLSYVHSFLFVRPIPAAEISYTPLSIPTAATAATAAASGASTTPDINSSAAETTTLKDIIAQKFNGNDYWNQYEGTNNVRSAGFVNSFQFCTKSIHWKEIEDTEGVHQLLRTCKGNGGKEFRIVCAIKREGFPYKDSVGIPGHSLTLWPPLRLHNLLPCDLLYKLPTGTQGRVGSSDTENIHDVDLEDQLEITITLDGYPRPGPICIPSGLVGAAEITLRLTDIKGRSLNLNISIMVCKGSGMQLSISTPFWLVNRTGLPLVFRQEGVALESAGQFDENEQARLLSPLMYSIADPEASPTMTMRLGKRFGSTPPWCQPFSLHKDIITRHLNSANSNETFVIGIEVRPGRGRYNKTSVITFSPRFQLYNRSSFKLQFAQKCFATSMSDSMSKMTFIEAVPGCHLPFHWPRLDRNQELCIRLPDIPNCLWSGGIPIHETQSLYINIRNSNGDMHFLRVEIVLQGATYFLLFGEAQVLPPPIRVDNYSEVSMKFYQPDCRQQWRTVVRPHSSISYALDEPMGGQTLCLEAPGGVSYTYSLRNLGMSNNLTYENFIYIAFSGTFKNVNDTYGAAATSGDFDIESQQLVLSVVDGGRVVLARKQTGNRAQLWRMNKEKQLEHEGSSPPTEPGKQSSQLTPRYVLDLERAPQPLKDTCLVVRSSNKQRRSTQTWHFTEEGRLMCEHANMCVQARGGFFGLCANSDAVLGMIVSDTHVITESLVPLEQAIERQKLRPGSGFLSVAVIMDGPIKTIQIKDIKSLNTSILLSLDPTWQHVSHLLPHISQHKKPKHLPPTNSSSTTNNNNNNGGDLATSNTSTLGEYHLNLKLQKGVGLSLISRQPREEICFISLEDITMELVATPAVHSLDLSVTDVQIDNQLFETPCPVMLYTIKNIINDQHQTSSGNNLSALQLNIVQLPSPNTNAVIFENLILSLRPLAIFLEERLILRLAQFFGIGTSQVDPSSLPDESDYEAQRVATQILAANAKRYYFGDLQIVPSQIRLSVITASKLSPQLSEIKKSLGLTLIKFEDASIDFEKFTDKHHFDTKEVYLRAIKSHYRQELKWQAGSILGSVDFLGNPSGLANDLQEGVSGLIFEGSVKSLVKNVTHGLSNSTAKLTESLSDGLGRVVFDEQDTETRQRILEMSSGTNSTGEHLKAGLKGFGFGLLGGMTSIVKHTYAGAQTDGIQGFISGLGKGIVGTVTKPVIGVLDLASETANAVRETSKSSHRNLPERKRLPRCLSGAPNGLLPQYSMIQSKGQQHLFLINKRDFTEQFMAYEPCLLERRESKLRLLVSNENVWVFSRTEESTTIVFSYHLSELISCRPVSVNVAAEGHKTKKFQYYIELCLSLASKTSNYGGPEVVKRPRVRCQTEEMSQRASRHINYAKSVYDERAHTLICEPSLTDT